MIMKDEALVETRRGKNLTFLLIYHPFFAVLDQSDNDLHWIQDDMYLLEGSRNNIDVAKMAKWNVRDNREKGKKSN